MLANVKTLLLTSSILWFSACSSLKPVVNTSTNSETKDSASVTIVSKDTVIKTPESKSGLGIPLSSLQDSSFRGYLRDYPIVDKSGASTTKVYIKRDTVFIESKCDSLQQIVTKQSVEISKYQSQLKDSSSAKVTVIEVPRKKGTFDKFLLYWFLVTGSVALMYVADKTKRIWTKFI